MIVAGLGCRKDVSEDEVLAAIDAALKFHNVPLSDIAALAVPEQKTEEKGIQAAASTLDLMVLVVGRALLQTMQTKTLSHSALSVETTGASSASEAAALAAIGVGRLLGPRIATGPVTCALATGEVLP